MTPTLLPSRYSGTADYERGLAATRELWLQPGLFGLAGVYILLGYLAIPELLEVGTHGATTRFGIRRGGLITQREQQFLRRVLGITSERSWGGGIANPRVLASLKLLHRRHASLPRMQPAYLSYLAGIIAISAIDVASASAPMPTESLVEAYWRYMRAAFLAMRIIVHDDANAQREACHSFAAYRVARSEVGDVLLQLLAGSQPLLLERATSLHLLPIRRAILSMWGQPADADRCAVALRS